MSSSTPELEQEKVKVGLVKTSESRFEKVVAVSFALSLLASIGLGIVYWQGGQTQAEGALLFFALGGLGFGIVAWGKYLVPQGPYVQEREELKSPESERAVLIESLERGVTQIERRSFLVKLLGVSIAAFGVITLFPFIRSLGPQPKKMLYVTNWKKGSALVRSDGSKVRASDLEVGGVLTVFPEGHAGGAISQTILIRPSFEDIVTKPGRETWGPQGYLAYSKVCTHAGCPVGLYQELTQQLLCPCHQSLFDVMTGANPVFGPAPRPLPQLPLEIDSQGFLLAQAGYDEPIGPGFWERA
ncbi:MAG: ubiquinol-cytochrome c reductase iron-sulfur subunit [Acidimicrobiaceae bacterium]|nr:ubiquinol-cytochrome c reductase iron-sulfur subunit [Acidimicrobiaceae bacterium]